MGNGSLQVDSLKAGIRQEWYAVDRSGFMAQVVTPEFLGGLPRMATYDGWGWFARTFKVERVDSSAEHLLAGVDDEAQVWGERQERR